jgi:hypothetical protein
MRPLQPLPEERVVSLHPVGNGRRRPGSNTGHPDWHRTPGATPPVFTEVRGLTLSPHAKQLSVAVAGAEAVQVVDLTSQRAAGEILVGSSPQQVVTLPNGTTGLVVSRGPEILACFDSRCYTVSQTIRVGTNPHGLAGSIVERTAYVAHEGSQDVSVVEGASRTVTATRPCRQRSAYDRGAAWLWRTGHDTSTHSAVAHARHNADLRPRHPGGPRIDGKRTRDRRVDGVDGRECSAVPLGTVSPSPARPTIVVESPPSTAPRDAGHAGIVEVFLTCADQPCIRLFPARTCQTGTDVLHVVGHYPPWSACAILGPPRRASRPFRLSCR